jgi:vitamin B12 transporter
MIAALVVAALAVQQPQDTLVLKPVVVTATRIPMPVDFVASPVTVLRGSDLAAQGIRTVAEALRGVTGSHVVETGSFGGQTALFLRGGENDYVKVLVDGVPLNRPGGGMDLAHLTTDNIERIEIVSGPGSVLYGSDAVTGVIQIFTRNGLGPARVGAELRRGTYATTEGAVDLEGGTKTVGYSVRTSRLTSDGIYPINNRYRNSVASARLRLTPDAQTEANLSYRYGDNLYHFPTNGQGQPADSNQRSAERGPLMSLGVNRTMAGGRVETRILASLREARLFSNDEPDSPGEDGTFWSSDYVRRAAGSALVSWRPQGSTAFTAGVEYEEERQRGRSEFSGSFGTFPDSILVRRSTASYFVQAVLDAWPLAVSAGARVDDNSQFGTHGTYRVGFIFRPRPESRVRLSIGTGFKEPTFFENYAHGFGALGNPDLQPERSLSWEVGIDRTLAGGRITVAGTYFRQRFRDLIEYTGSPPSGEPNYFNVSGATAGGLEARVEWILTPAVALVLPYTYLHTRVQEGSLDGGADGLFVAGAPLVRRPRHTFAPLVSATLGTRTRLTIGARYVGLRDDLDFNRPAGSRRVTLAPYTQMSTAVECSIGNLEVSGRVDNVFDDRSPEIAAFRPRGRVISLGGRVTFGF